MSAKQSKSTPSSPKRAAANKAKPSGAKGARGAQRAQGSKDAKHATGAKRAQGSTRAPGAKAAPAAAPVPERTPLLDSRLKNDLAGVLIAVAAIALLIAVVSPGNAILARVISDTFRLGFGVGAYILPVLLLAWGASFFVRQTFADSTFRLGLGMAIIYVSVIALVAVNTPDASATPAAIFANEELVAHGGYVGGGVAWFLLTLVGQVIATVVLAGFVLGGIVIIGFSVTGLVARIAALFGFGEQPDEDTATEGGAYNLGGQKRASSGKAQLLAPTTRLGGNGGNGNGIGGGGSDLTDVLYGDAFKDGQQQGRLPLEAAENLGATRRINGGSDAQTVALGAQKAGKKQTADAKNGEKKQASNAAADGLGSFVLPDPRILKVSKDKATSKAGGNELRQTADHLQATLDQFGVEGQVVGWIAGPTVTLYKISLEPGVRLNKVTNLQHDLELALAAPAVRIVAPIPGTSLVGIEVPNSLRNDVLLGDVLPYSEGLPLDLAIGKDVEGNAITANLAKMPHLLIGGTTGSGKSVAINAMIMSMLMQATPQEVRMIFVDPKRVELSLYNGIPHLYVPVVTDPQKAASALAWGVIEMERRLKVFEKEGVRNVGQHNAKAHEAAEKFEAQAAKQAAQAAQAAHAAEAAEGAHAAHAADSAAPAKRLAPDTQSDELPEVMPYIVIVIDELADLMMTVGKEVEGSIVRIAQLGRAAGIHLIVATQRPSSNVITGLIKANITNRIAFNVATGIDSRVILDSSGAENLIGLGDLLFSKPEFGKPVRIQGCFVTEGETQTVVEFLQSQGEPDYHEDILSTKMAGSMVGASGSEGGGESDDDPLLWEAADIVASSGFGSTSTLQRRLKVGYARAGRIMDMLENKGIVGPANGSKPREVLVDTLELESLKAFEQSDGIDESW